MDLIGNLDLNGGELRNAKSHLYTALPTYASSDVGRLIYVTAGADQGYWFGNAQGTGAWTKMSLGTSLGTWALSSSTINNGVTLQSTITASGYGTLPEDGIIYKIALTSTLSSGMVTVSIYNDLARAEKIYECVFDLASGVLIDRIPVGFELDNTSGYLYTDITNNTGSSGNFTLTVLGTSIIPVPSAAPPGTGSGINSGVAGDGIAYDAVNLRLELDLDANPALEYNGAGGAGKVRVKTDPAGGLARAAAGLQCDSTVIRSTGNQLAIAGQKQFTALALTPAVGAGPPAAGAHIAGEFFMDLNLDVWMCTVAGTPGSWTFWGWKEQNLGGAVAGSSYTAACAATTSVDLALVATGRRGVIRKAVVWGADDAFAVVDVDAPFRLEAYPNENYEGREMLWTIAGQIRSTNFSGAEAAPQSTLDVNTVGNVALDDLARLRNTVVEEEYGRVTVRTPGGPSIDVDEVTVYDYLLNDPVMYCTEALELYWKNNSAVPANYYKIYLRFYNDHPTQDLIFGYQFFIENIGGGQPV